MAKRDIIVMGASLGGMSAIRQVCAALPADFSASVFVVWHTASGPNPLAEVLNRSGPRCRRRSRAMASPSNRAACTSLPSIII